MSFPLYPQPRTRKQAMYALNKAFPGAQSSPLYDLIGPEISIVDTAVTARVNSTLALDPGLVVNVLAGVPYLMEMYLSVTTTATPGFKFDFNGGNVNSTTSSGTTIFGRSTFSTAAAAALAYVDPTALNTANNPAAAAYTQVYFRGVILPTLSGTVGVQWAQSVTNATGSTVNALSYLKIEPAVSLFGR